MSTAASWQLDLAKSARKDLDALPERDRTAILRALDELRADPFGHHNAERLREHVFGWRLRVRAYRVLYDLDPIVRTIVVARIERRSTTTYRRRR
jgi:mRNA interferase RelE/StbE